MIFGEITYYIFFLIPCATLFHLLHQKARAWIIVFFGTLFFAYYANIHFGGLKGSLCVLIFAWELLISRLYKQKSFWCVLGIIQALAFLAAFKYLGFFSKVWIDLTALFGTASFQHPTRLVLPLGISFFTFEFIHFAVDSYQGKIKKSLLSEYAAFIFFFPTMVAGPIKRYQDFLPKLRSAKFDPLVIRCGITRILSGLAKKVILADTFSLWAVNLNQEALQTANSITVILWILAYAMKIYFDFSGYSDIAIGSAQIFGITVPENFDWPYFSRNIAEFWRRWHISLGRWIFDYIYIPLGGSKRGNIITALILLVSFGLSGLWHGASYNFIIWGLWHGGLFILYRIWLMWTKPRNIILPTFVSTSITFVTVTLGWAFFCMDSKTAIFALEKIIGAS